MKKLRLFLDTTFLGLSYLNKIDELPYDIEYFYPCVDPYHINKADEITAVQNLRATGYRGVLNYNINSFKKIDSSKKFIGRFSVIMRPDQTQVLGQNFTNNGPIENRRSEHLEMDKASMARFEQILIKLKTINPAWKDFIKDMYTIATVLFIDERYVFIQTLGDKGAWYLNLGKVPVVNSDNKKYFITQDERGFFSTKILEKMEKEFPDFVVINYKNLSSGIF